MAALAMMVPVARLQAAPQWQPLPTQRYSSTSPAYDEGYQRGVRAGENDGRLRRSFNFADESDYRRADTGYRSQFGNRDRYRDQFRSGFEQGYRAGYARYGSELRNGRLPNGNYSGNYNSGNYNGGNYGGGNYGGGNFGGGYAQNTNVAFQNGSADGYDEGLNDGRNRHADDPVAESRYRNADHGFNGRYGSRDLYRNAYRQGFLQGYERGYREGRSYR
jgi:hypothetical protein